VLDAFEPAPGLLTASELADLTDEAAGSRVEVERNERDEFSLAEGERLLGPVRNQWSTAGTRRADLHGELAERLAGRLGPDPVPTVSCYLYYGTGDFIDLHKDQPRCEVELLVWLAGDAGPLCLHPELAALPPEELLATARSGVHPPGVAVRLQDAPLLLAGGVIPHHRPPHGGRERVALAAFCFALGP